MIDKLKVLWFSIAPNLKDLALGGSWIGALKDVVKKHKDIDLSIVFATNDNSVKDKTELEGITYYSIKTNRNFIQRKYVDTFTHVFNDKITIEKSMCIIREVRPDIIHVWGSEWCYGEISQLTKIPVVIHMQGCWPPYRYAGGDDLTKFLSDAITHWYKPYHIFWNILDLHGSKERARREENILRTNKYFMCRTRWDKALINLYAPNSKIYLCEEALRVDFTNCNKRWKKHNTNRLKLITVGINPIKGIREIMTAAKLLVDNTNIDFEWKLCGANTGYIKELERSLNVSCSKIFINPIGKCNSSKLIEELLDSDIYVHASHIDNSPNAVCEAQYLGLPIIATNVGGIPSLFDKSYPLDFLIPSWDPYYLASKVKELSENVELMEAMSEMNYKIAHFRHDPNHIYNQLLSIYNNILYNAEN